MRRSASSALISSKIPLPTPTTSVPMDFNSKASKLPPRMQLPGSYAHNSYGHSLSLPFLPHPTQLPPRASTAGGSSSKPNSGGRLGFVCTSLFFSAICLLIVYLFWFSRGSSNFKNLSNRGYIIIIDAGSSGSRAHVFHYTNDDGGPLPLVSFSGNEASSLKTRPGLSSFAEEPRNAGESLAQLIVFASSKVPERERSATRIYLMATAGLRMLTPAVQDGILESCRVVLRTSGFSFQDEWASVISGTDEGVYAWIAANYALGRLGKSPEDTVGIIELGGASAQITFVPETPPPPEFLHTIDLGGIKYALYTHSFLHFGQEAAWNGVMRSFVSDSSSQSTNGAVVDPCTPRGFSVSHGRHVQVLKTAIEGDKLELPSLLSAGNFSECRNLAVKLLQTGQGKI